MTWLESIVTGLVIVVVSLGVFALSYAVAHIAAHGQVRRLRARSGLDVGPALRGRPRLHGDLCGCVDCAAARQRDQGGDDGV